MRKVNSKTPKSKHYKVLRNGVMKIGPECDNILAEFNKSTKIPDYLGAVDHSLKIGKKREYKRALRKQQELFNQYVHEMKALGLNLVIVLQGRDGAGKTGTVTTLDKALWHDARTFRSIPIGAPTQEELAHPYLWRFGKYDNMPGHGQVRVFDRSWQERVLVEKVKKLTPEYQLQKSYTELRHFEWGLQRHGTVLVKIWLDITYEEQGRRFEDRLREKPGKVTKADDEARELWHEHTPASNEMIHRTATKGAPQYVVSSEDKPYCHVAVLEVVNHELKKRLKQAKAEVERANKK